MSTNFGTAHDFSQLLQDLGGISTDRVRLEPSPGDATLQDLITVNHSTQRYCELIDGTLVEKAMGYEASVVAGTILRLLANFVSVQRLGLISGADGMFRLLPTSTRGPDVAFLHRERLPDGKFPKEPYPSLAPNLAVEVLSPGNTLAEMTRKRTEYLHAGVQLVWIVDCVHRTIAVYNSEGQRAILKETDTLGGATVLPGFECLVADVFVDLDIKLED